MVNKVRQWLYKEAIYQHVAALSASFAMLIVGVNLGWSSPYLHRIANGEYPELQMTRGEEFWCATLPILVSPLGALISLLMTDRISRKKMILAWAPVALVSFVVLALSKNLTSLFAARFLLGLVEGGLMTSLPLYFVEISEASTRGVLFSMMGAYKMIGVWLINVLGFYSSIFVSSLVCTVIPVIHVVTFLRMPPSPYWYIKNGYFEEAKDILRLLRGTADVEDDFQKMLNSLWEEKLVRSKYVIMDLFRVGCNRRALLVYFIIILTKIFTGIVPFNYFAPNLFIDVPNLSIDAAVLIFVSIQAVATCMGSLSVENINRRPLFMVTTLGCILSLTVTGTYFFMKQDSLQMDHDVLKFIPLAALVVFALCFGLGLEQTSTIFLGELFPMEVIVGANILGGFLASFVAVFSTVIFREGINEVNIYLPFWIFAACCTVCFGLVYAYVPETRNKTLEEIQWLLKSKTEETSMTYDVEKLPDVPNIETEDKKDSNVDKDNIEKDGPNEKNVTENEEENIQEKDVEMLLNAAYIKEGEEIVNNENGVVEENISTKNVNQNNDSLLDLASTEEDGDKLASAATVKEVEKKDFENIPKIVISHTYTHI